MKKKFFWIVIIIIYGTVIIWANLEKLSDKTSFVVGALILFSLMFLQLIIPKIYK